MILEVKRLTDQCKVMLEQVEVEGHETNQLEIEDDKMNQLEVEDGEMNQSEVEDGDMNQSEVEDDEMDADAQQTSVLMCDTLLAHQRAGG